MTFNPATQYRNKNGIFEIQPHGETHLNFHAWNIDKELEPYSKQVLKPPTC